MLESADSWNLGASDEPLGAEAGRLTAAPSPATPISKGETLPNFLPQVDVGPTILATIFVGLAFEILMSPSRRRR